MAELYGRLFRYRAREKRAPLEDFLSEALVDLLQRMPNELIVELVETMLGKSSAGWRQFAEPHLLQWSTQRHVDGDRRGFIDILLEVDGRPAIVIENKVGSGVRQHGRDAEGGLSADLNQLSTYGRWLRQNRHREWPGALILLSHITHPPADFLEPGASHYGVEARSTFSWSKLARWLAVQTTAGPQDPPAVWQTLAHEFLDFLREHHMTTETVSSTDLAALQIFMPSAQRLIETLQRAWGATADARTSICSHKNSSFQLDWKYPGILWGWKYIQRNGIPSSSFVALGLRFPDVSDWWQNVALPDRPHIFFSIEDDNDRFPIGHARDLPAGWLRTDTDLVVGKALQDFPAEPQAFADALSDWSAERAREAVVIIDAMCRTLA
jgi:hypothetical protein